jgi:hypothetical protein
MLAIAKLSSSAMKAERSPQDFLHRVPRLSPLFSEPVHDFSQVVHTWGMRKRRYLSDMSRERFEQIRPILEQARKRTKPRSVDLYKVWCAVLYLLHTGCQELFSLVKTK